MASTIPNGGTHFAFIPLVPTKGKDLQINFRALVDSINDSYSPQWSEHMDMGRADPKNMYNQFSRNVSIDFKIMALNKGEHYKNMHAMNSLAELTYPKYKTGKGFNGIYVRMYLGEYIDIIGIITSLSFNVDNESPWVDDIPLYVQCSLDMKYVGKDKPNYKSPGESGPYYRGRFEQGIK